MARNHIRNRILTSWWLRHIVIGTTAFVLLFLFALYLIPASALHEYVHTHIASAENFNPDEFGLTATPFTVTTADDLALEGEEFRAEHTKGVVIMTPGLYNPVASALYGHVKLFLENDLSVIVYSPRAHSGSEGKLVGHGITEVADVNAMIEYVRSFTAYLNLPIILAGWNTGAATSINAAAQNESVSAVIAIGSYYNTHEYFSEMMKDEAQVPEYFQSIGEDFLNTYLRITYGKSAIENSPDKSLESLSECPIFFIHSTGDNFISYTDSQSLFEKASPQSEVWIRDIDYSYVTGYFINLNKDPEYCEKIIGFLNGLQFLQTEEGVEE